MPYRVVAGQQEIASTQNRHSGKTGAEWNRAGRVYGRGVWRSQSTAEECTRLSWEPRSLRRDTFVEGRIQTERHFSFRRFLSLSAASTRGTSFGQVKLQTCKARVEASKLHCALL